ncbi:uncharacterized protein LOC126885922 [Diabrotica virgifera virgifera]|uniref:Uncharacterized protein n=1 Tax=Diabrotica virgifera virgifera TaxID=50390 RepID=A0ABM5KES1_DIAVI|nr:uncharacterized protein LOC126885922 [Diabrotica virgifera virgifera]
MNSLYWILPLTVCIFYGLNGGQALQQSVQCYSCAGPRNSTNSSCATNITRLGARITPNCTGTFCSTFLTNSTVTRGCVFVRTCPYGQTCNFCNSTNFCNNMTYPTYPNKPGYPVYPSYPGHPTHSKKGGAEEITVSITALLVCALLNLIMPKLNL